MSFGQSFHVLVCVTGDLGRSTRMLRHAGQFALRGTQVTLIGTGATPLPQWITRHDSISVHRTPGWEHVRTDGALFWLAAALRQILLAGSLFRPLAAAASKRTLILVQVPPAFPLLPLAASFRRRGARIIVDWHNRTGAMLRSGGRSDVLARGVHALEVRAARSADGHVCVSQAMSDALKRDGHDACVLYDRPVIRGRIAPASNGIARNANDSPVFVAPSSWSSDDDFLLLRDALAAMDRAQGQPFVVRLTGDGPRRREMLRELQSVSLQRASILWRDYPADDYDEALATADFGLSLHRSTSGQDIPIKIAEMRAHGLPVCALHSGAIDEVFTPGIDGILFRDAAGLAVAMEEMLTGSFQRQQYTGAPWAEEWERVMVPLVRRTMELA